MVEDDGQQTVLCVSLQRYPCNALAGCQTVMVEDDGLQTVPCVTLHRYHCNALQDV